MRCWNYSTRVGESARYPTVCERCLEALEEIEKEHILETLQHTDWNKSQAASILNIERSTLDRKIKGYELKR